MYEAALVQALKLQKKKFLRAVDRHDGHKQCEALGVIEMHSERLAGEYGISQAQIEEYLREAEAEYENEKAGQKGRQ